eukprot:scaffold405602_cov38-Prasinocladus_malaysianus.AAC.1
MQKRLKKLKKFVGKTAADPTNKRKDSELPHLTPPAAPPQAETFENDECSVYSPGCRLTSKAPHRAGLVGSCLPIRTKSGKTGGIRLKGPAGAQPALDPHLPRKSRVNLRTVWTIPHPTYNPKPAKRTTSSASQIQAHGNNNNAPGDNEAPSQGITYTKSSAERTHSCIPSDPTLARASQPSGSSQVVIQFNTSQDATDFKQQGIGYQIGSFLGGKAQLSNVVRPSVKETAKNQPHRDLSPGSRMRKPFAWSLATLNVLAMVVGLSVSVTAFIGALGGGCFDALKYSCWTLTLLGGAAMLLLTCSRGLCGANGSSPKDCWWRLSSPS